MTLLTAAGIKAILDAVFFSFNIKAINAFVVQDENKRLYRSIDIENITAREETENVPTTSTKQIYLVTLYARIGGSGSQTEPEVQTLEEQIFDALDTAQGMDSKIIITQSWDRKHEVFPVTRIKSTLRVMTEEISSTDGEGIKGDTVTITLPSPVDTINVINVLTDEAGIIKDLDLETDGKRVHTKIRNDGLLSVEIAINVTAQNNIKEMIFAGDDISITVTKGGTADARTANLNTLIDSGSRGEILKQILNMDIEY